MKKKTTQQATSSFLKQIEVLKKHPTAAKAGMTIGCLIPAFTWSIAHFWQYLITEHLMGLSYRDTATTIVMGGLAFSSITICQAMYKLGGSTLFSAIKAISFTTLLELSMAMTFWAFALLPLLVLCVYNGIGIADLLINQGKLTKARAKRSATKTSSKDNKIRPIYAVK